MDFKRTMSDAMAAMGLIFSRRVIVTGAVMIGSACALPALTSANGRPETKPATVRPSKAERKDAATLGTSPKAAATGLLRRLRIGATTQPASSPEEWWDVEKFMRANSPTKFEIFEEMPDKPLKQKIRTGIISRYKELKRLEAGDRDLYDIEVQRVRIEDSLYAALRDYHRAKDERERSIAHRALREQVARLVDNHQAARQHRADRLTYQLQQINSETARAAQQREKRIENQTEQILRRGLTGQQHRGMEGRSGRKSAVQAEAAPAQ